ncbi:MAG: preprotein translocase subunit SecY [Patescibacteria group bacterium]|nr:preprotein translocase subunit SecY [Patescibacteria group bacterium]
MWKKFFQVFKIKDLRKSIFSVIGMLVIFRIAAHIPVPGVDIEALKEFFGSNQVFGLVNVLSGGAMSNFSIIALSIGPYITASIIFQLLVMIIPKLEELSKEGEAGQRKINQYTRLLTVPLAVMQAYSMIILLSRSQQGIIQNIAGWQTVITVLIMTAGTMFLVWLGELISEKNIGNGISLIICAGIIAQLPTTLQQMVVTFTTSQITNLIVFAILGIITIAGIVYITEAQRNIPISYARRIRGRRMYGGTDTFLPLRVNQAGMIPIIFAISLVLFPSLIGQLLTRARLDWVSQIGYFLIEMFKNQWIYGLIYFSLVVAFTYFYTSVVFHPHQIADNLKRQGGFVPGIRPGATTADYIGHVSTRIMLAGALFLGVIAILPLITQQFLGFQGMLVGGAGILIIVSVILETGKKLDSQLSMREYEGL